MGYDNGGVYTAFRENGIVTIGGVTGISYNYNSSKKEWKLTKTGNFTVANVKAILDKISFKAGSSSQTSVRKIEITIKNEKDISSLPREQNISYVKNYYVGATNITDATADIVFPLMNNRNFDVYVNSSKVGSLIDAKSGTKKETKSNTGVIKITGLLPNTPTNVSIVMKQGATETFIGSYGFVTGPKLYLDSTIPQIATNFSGTWFNIASSGAVRNSRLSKMTYSVPNKIFESMQGGNIFFKELSDVRAIFLVAELTNQNSFLAGHINNKDFQGNINNDQLINDQLNNGYSKGQHWLVTNKVENKNDFVILPGVFTYGARIENDTANPLKANQLRDKFNSSSLWKGRFEKYIIFDSSFISEKSCQTIIEFLNKKRIADHNKNNITGKLNYEATYAKVANSTEINVSLENVNPFGVRSLAFNYELDNTSPSFPTGISINTTTGKITIATGATKSSNTYKVKATVENNGIYTGKVLGEAVITLNSLTLSAEKELVVLVADNYNSLGPFSTDGNLGEKIVNIRLGYSDLIDRDSVDSFYYKNNSGSFVIFNSSTVNNISIGDVAGINYSYDAESKSWTFSKNDNFTIEEAKKILNKIYFKTKSIRNVIKNVSILLSTSSDTIFFNKKINIIGATVGATNIIANSANIVYSVLPQYSKYKIYIQESQKPETITKVEEGTLKKTTTITKNISVKSDIIDGLSLYKGYYVSIVGEETDKNSIWMGSYGFVTGAKLYWDATVPLIATNRIGHWFNIAYSGSNYDGVIGNSGKDFSYNIATKTFYNNEDSKKITFTEVTDIRAVFLVANVSDQRTCILANSAGANIPHGKSNVPELINASGGNARVRGGKFWIGINKINARADFDFALNNNRVYGILVNTTAGATAVRANTTKFTTYNEYVWRGKFQKYLIFNSAMTEAAAQSIATFLDADK